MKRLLRTLLLLIAAVALLGALNEGITRVVAIYRDTETDDLSALSLPVRLLGNPYNVQILILAGINVILAVSLNLINGVTGQFSIGHAGFMAIGGYSAAAFTKFVGPTLIASLHLSQLAASNLLLPVALVVAALAAAVSGLLVGVPSLRLRGDYLAIVTLGFGEIILVLIVNIDAIGGARGFADLPLYTNFFWVYLMALVTVLLVRNLMHSAHGRALMAVRDDEVAAEAMGINTTLYKVAAFVIGSSLAGVAGGLYGHFIQSLHPNSFTFLKSVEVLVMIVLGGLGSLSGAIFAAIGLTVLQEVLREVPGVMWVSYALAVLGAVISRDQYAERRAYFVVRLVVTLAALWALFHFGREELEARKQYLRMIVYSLMLVILMLLRPQGLLGREELGLGALRRLRTRGKGGGAVAA